MTLSKWLRRAAVDDGDKPGVSTTEAVEDRELRRRVKLLEQENEVLRQLVGLRQRKGQLLVGRLTPVEYETIMTPPTTPGRITNLSPLPAADPGAFG